MTARFSGSNNTIGGIAPGEANIVGMDFGDVVRATVYLTDINGYGEMNQAYAQYFEDFDPPSRVAMEISGLVGGALIEISFIAVKTD